MRYSRKKCRFFAELTRELVFDLEIAGANLNDEQSLREHLHYKGYQLHGEEFYNRELFDGEMKESTVQRTILMYNHIKKYGYEYKGMDARIGKQILDIING